MKRCAAINFLFDRIFLTFLESFLRETAYQAKVYCENYFKDTGIRLELRPYVCGNLCGCCNLFGAPVDAVNFYTDEENRLLAQVSESI